MNLLPSQMVKRSSGANGSAQPGPTSTFWLELLILVMGSMGILAEANGASAQYFRSDGGAAPADRIGPLPERLEAETLHWRSALDSGHSTPVIHGESIFATTYNADAAQLATVALDLRTGEPRWKRVAPAGQIEEFHRLTGNAAQATPACDGERLFVFFGSCGLLCYDLEGRLLWQHRLGPFQDEYGSGSSPVLLDDKVVIQQDHDVGSFLMALERTTGKLLWKHARPDAVRSYSTPAVWTRQGRAELLVAGALELAGHDPGTGEKLWWTGGLARIVIPVPLPHGDTIFMASWAPGGDAGRRLALPEWEVAIGRWDQNRDGRLARAEIADEEVLDRFFRMDLDQSGELTQPEWERHAAVFQRAQNALLALRPSATRGELPAGDLVWKHTRGVPYVASPVIAANAVWMVKDGGIVTKLDAATGRVLEEERLPGSGGYYASPVAGDGKIYFASEQGTVSVVAAPAWRVLSSREFREKIHATPVLHGTSVYVRTAGALYRFDAAKPSP